jgi:thermostable hemolysin
MSAILSSRTKLTGSNALRSNGTCRRFHQLLSHNPEVDLHYSDTPRRSEIERYIADQFQMAYGAAISHFMPLILSLMCNDKLSAVTGICPAGTQPLFVEQYLKGSIEEEINRFTATPAMRENIVEIGNLAANQPGSSQLLFILLASILHRAEFEWLVFTATPQVQKTISKLGFELHPIAEANPEHINNFDIKSWGTYYNNKPFVVAGHLSHAMDTINHRQLLKEILSLYQNRIEPLANLITNQRYAHDQYYFAA